jgi:hypothetical protein
MKLMARVVFSGEVKHDSDGAADALTPFGIVSGFKVRLRIFHGERIEVAMHRMPEAHPPLEPGDDFIEVVTHGPAGPPPSDLAYPVGKLARVMMREVDNLAKCYGGICHGVRSVRRRLRAFHPDVLRLDVRDRDPVQEAGGRLTPRARNGCLACWHTR